MNQKTIHDFFFTNNLFISVGIVISLCLLIWFYGCESKVRSLEDPRVLVTRCELEIELESHLSQVETQLDLYIQKADIKFRRLDSLDQIKKTLLNFLALYAETGVINPAGIVSAIIGILGTGAIVDNIRVRKNNKKASA